MIQQQSSRPRTATLALAGNPNCGKTTLFNFLTKSGEAVGNRAGVTFAPKEARMRRFGNFDAQIVDLPGIYSLYPYGNEEKAAERYLKSGKYSTVINIADATNLERSLYLTLQLIDRGIRVVLALNMMDEAEKEHLKIDIPALSAALGIPVYAISAAHGTGVRELIAGVLKAPPAPPRPFGYGTDSRAIHQTAGKILQRTVRREQKKPSFSDRLDRMICRPFVGLPLFLAVVFLVFLLTFSSVGGYLTEQLEKLFSYLGGSLYELLARLGVSEGIRHFLTDGIFSGVAAVLSFMPQTAILFLLLALLEDSGYMARAAFVMDSTLRPFGLSGKAFIPMLIGFGCTVPAVLSTTTLDEKEKETAIFSLPFIPCSARFPIFAMLISTFFEKYAALAAFSIYLLGILAAVFSAFLHSRSKSGCPAPPLTIELPKYRMPRIRNLMREVGAKLKDFLIRAGTIVFLSCVVISILSSLSPDLTPAENGEDSILAAFGRLFSAPFALLGFGDGRILSALAAGFFAKESIVSTIEILIPQGLSSVLSPAGAASLAVFSLLYTPCAATLSAIRKELGGRKALYTLFRCLLFAFAASFLVYTIFRLFAWMA